MGVKLNLCPRKASGNYRGAGFSLESNGLHESAHEPRRAVSREVFLDELEVSPATFKRDLEHMRDFLYAPVIYDRDREGYREAWSCKASRKPG